MGVIVVALVTRLYTPLSGRLCLYPKQRYPLVARRRLWGIVPTERARQAGLPSAGRDLEGGGELQRRPRQRTMRPKYALYQRMVL
jgi:hypothetical protein